MLCAQTESLNTEEVGPYVYVSPSLLLLRLLGDQALVDVGDHTCGGVEGRWIMREAFLDRSLTTLSQGHKSSNKETS